MKNNKSITSKYTVFACDTESSTDTGKVWAVQCAPLDSPNDDVLIYNNFDELLNPIIHHESKFDTNILFYFHNLKWDAQHIIRWLFDHNYQWTFDQKLYPGEFNTLITDMGQFYTIRVRVGRNILEIRDSLKLLPFSLKKMAKDFKLKHQKLEMDYDKHNLDECTEQDLEYLKNDVLVLKDALNFMFDKNMTELTIGGCCMSEYKAMTQPEQYWCDLLKFIEPNTGLDADEYVRNSYHGGYCIAWKTGRFQAGQTYDVNSLYPSMMNSDRLYPVGEPHFFTGDKIPHRANIVYIIRFKCDFELKPNKLPTLQIKHSLAFASNEWLRSNKVYGTLDGKPVDNHPDIYMTSVDFKLFKQNYNISNLEILDGCWFNTVCGTVLFGKYIEYWARIKQESTGALRQLAKLMLNNLYGKLATSRRSSYRQPYINDKNVLAYKIQVNKKDKKLTYIPQATFITSYAREFTIKTAQANIDRLCYIDTDSIHITGLEQPKGLVEHPTKFSCWKCESTWNDAIFVRQKTYCEHVIEEDHKSVEPSWNIKACGLPERAKQLFLAKCELIKLDDLTEEESLYVKTKSDISEFAVGLHIPFGKLVPKNTEQGVILEERGFTVNKRTSRG